MLHIKKELITLLTETCEDHPLQNFLANLEKRQILVADEFCCVPFTKASAKLLFEVKICGYDCQSHAATIDLPLGKWNEVLFNERLTHRTEAGTYHSGYALEFDC